MRALFDSTYVYIYAFAFIFFAISAEHLSKEQNNK